MNWKMLSWRGLKFFIVILLKLSFESKSPLEKMNGIFTPRAWLLRCIVYKKRNEIKPRVIFIQPMLGGCFSTDSLVRRNSSCKGHMCRVAVSLSPSQNEVTASPHRTRHEARRPQTHTEHVHSSLLSLSSSHSDALFSWGKDLSILFNLSLPCGSVTL